MRTRLCLILSALLCACASPEHASEADGLAHFGQTDLARIDTASCAEELAAKKHGERWWLCGYGWRPAVAEPGAERAIESYRLFWVRADAPRMVLRLARYEDGSGVLWVTTDDHKGPGPRTRVTVLKEPEFAPLFTRLMASPLWASSYAKVSTKNDETAGCKTPARWILEGQRTDDHRAVSVQSCGAGRWVIDLGTEMLKFAEAKMPGLPVGEIYQLE